ncbi:MAG TPA: nucleotide disphospho-sugar-binding domain-containing protein [Allosphingosinicella sp.]|jgi:MGT family glycosyltransferase
MSHVAPSSFLFATFEGGGSVGPALTVVRKLMARGHRVRVMSDACNRFEAEASGAAFVPWTRAPSRPDRSRETTLLRDFEAASPQEGLMRTVEGLMIGPSLAYARDLIDELEREPADLVVSNEMLFGVAVGCEAVGQRLALLTANISLFPLPGVPPMGPGLAPARTDEDRALHNAVAQGMKALLDSQLGALNAARAALGLPPLATAGDQMHAAERLLLGTSRAFDFAPATLPSNVRYVGPQIDPPAWAAPFVFPWPPGDRRPLALVAFSTTFQGHVGVIQRVVDAIADLPMRGLVTLGDTIAPEEVASPDNVRLVHSAPHDAVMRQAAIVVTHGGHGTVVRALLHRLPMLVMPHGRDQNDNAVRVTERGAGLALPNTATTAEIRAALSRLLSEPAFGRAAAALGERVAEEVESSPVVEELEGLIAAHASGAPQVAPACAGAHAGC